MKRPGDAALIAEWCGLLISTPSEFSAGATMSLQMYPILNTLSMHSNALGEQMFRTFRRGTNLHFSWLVAPITLLECEGSDERTESAHTRTPPRGPFLSQTSRARAPARER